MVSTILFSIVSIATLLTLLTAYRVSSTIRYRDQARFVLTTACDQFLRANAFHITNDTTVPKTYGLRPFFTVTEVAGVATPTGEGLSWYPPQTPYGGNTFVITPTTQTTLGANLRSLCVNGAVGSPYLEFDLPSSPSTPVKAQLSRMVRAIDPATGNPVSGQPTPTTAGYMLRGDFTISFTFQNRTYSESNAVLRTVK